MMAVFDEVIAQPPLSWAFGFGDGVADFHEGVDDCDPERSELIDDSGHRRNRDRDR
jgi:hypothetical protein